MVKAVRAKTYPSLAQGELQTFSKETDRVRLSGVAVKAYRTLCERWNLSNLEAAALLAVSSSTWDRIKRDDWKENLNQDQLTRVSALVGVFKGLHLIFADGMADKWPKLPNSGPLFSRRSPVDVAIEGGIPVMLDVRRYIDAVRGGV